jgi:hypothetical protein
MVKRDGEAALLQQTATFMVRKRFFSAVSDHELSWHILRDAVEGDRSPG